MLIFINLPTLITFLGVVLALAALVLALEGSPNIAWVCFIGAGLADLFDGLVARKTRMTAEQAKLGVQIDSLADMVSFGIVPAGLLYIMGLSGGITDYVFLCLYVLAVSQRLAYFNVHGMSDGAQTHYTGLPVTYSALVLPLLYIFQDAFLSDYAGLILMKTCLILLTVLYVSKLPVPKPVGVMYGIFPLIAIACSVYLLFT